MSIHSTDCKHGTDTYEYHCTECCAEEIRNLEMELDSLKNPAYCEKCGSCGKKDAVLQENVKLYKDFTVIVTSNPGKI